MFFVTYLHVFCAAFQNQNIIYRKWFWVPPSSYLLTASKTIEIAVIGYLGALQEVMAIIILILVMGTAGWTASFASMWMHNGNHKRAFG